MEQISESELRIWRALSWVSVLVLLGLGAWWMCYLPTVGKGGLFLAVGAVLMPLFWEKIGVIGKMSWMLMLFLLLGVEYRAIDKDRQDFADAEACRRKEENQQFSNIGDTITKNVDKLLANSNLQTQAIVTQATAQFNATMGKTQESIDNLTGGNSYPEVTAATFPLQGTANSFRLIFGIVGKNPLYDVDVNIRELPLPKTFNLTDFLTTGTVPGVSKVLSVPSFSPGIVQPFWAYFVTPAPNKVSDYQVVTHARNGKFVEILHLRDALDLLKLRGGIPSWEQSWEIERNGKIIERADWRVVQCNGCVITPAFPLGIMQP